MAVASSSRRSANSTSSSWPPRSPRQLGGWVSYHRLIRSSFSMSVCNAVSNACISWDFVGLDSLVGAGTAVSNRENKSSRLPIIPFNATNYMVGAEDDWHHLQVLLHGARALHALVGWEPYVIGLSPLP